MRALLCVAKQLRSAVPEAYSRSCRRHTQVCGVCPTTCALNQGKCTLSQGRPCQAQPEVSLHQWGCCQGCQSQAEPPGLQNRSQLEEDSVRLKEKCNQGNARLAALDAEDEPLMRLLLHSQLQPGAPA